MKVIITCGPSYEPIDEVRRITNFSTGELGATLSSAFAQAGYDTVCVRGVASTYPPPRDAATIPFATNNDLFDVISGLRTEEESGVFHAAALCDYRVRTVNDQQGQPYAGGKIPSRSGGLTLCLEPATKLISHLRDWFPSGILVGWKYELDRTVDSVLAKGAGQIRENRTNGCVLNGRAYGSGLGFMDEAGKLQHMSNKEAVTAFLVNWIALRSAKNLAAQV